MCIRDSYRDVLLTSMHAGAELVNLEQQAHIERLAQNWHEHRALDVIDAIETARMRLARGVTPVSYTHLDVYKRQQLHPDGDEQRALGGTDGSGGGHAAERSHDGLNDG